MTDASIFLRNALPLRQPLSLHAAARRFACCIHRWIERSRQRSALSRLGDEHLLDLGLSRADVARECAKPFWR